MMSLKIPNVMTNSPKDRLRVSLGSEVFKRTDTSPQSTHWRSMAGEGNSKPARLTDVDDSAKLATVILGVLPFPVSHTADNISAAKRSLMEEWGIEGKVTSIVTDAGANI